MTIWRVPYPRFGNGPGLERVAALAERLGLDLSGFGASGAVIVGSNGKGSTAAMTAALIQQGGGGVGLFTSPHLLDLNERFRMDNEDIGDTEFAHHWARVVAAIEAAGQCESVGGFEFLFLIAADWFAARGCRHTVWEAGIGGRLDPVRLIAARSVALTSLDLEHTALLGNTIEEIALEKIAAAPPSAQLFVSEATVEGQPALRATLSNWAAAHQVAIEFAPALTATSLPLRGQHQQNNAALALRTALSMTPLSEDQVGAGFAATRWPGRLQVLDENPLTVIDVGHTPAAVEAALAGFRAMCADRRAILLCGVSSDKDAAALLSRLAPGFSAIICAAARHKGLAPARIAALVQEANPAAEIVLADSVAEARRLALARARGGAIYCAGGLFLAAEFLAAHLGRDPAALAFF
jgi:dihydrofolate synthase/folylpolyglutamate synthase